jgi:hypothetical protein
LSVFEDLEDEHIMAIFNWAMYGSAGAPIEAEGGEVEMADLVKFHQGGERASVDAPGPDGADVLSASVSSARPA